MPEPQPVSSCPNPYFLNLFWCCRLLSGLALVVWESRSCSQLRFLFLVLPPKFFYPPAQVAARGCLMLPPPALVRDFPASGSPVWAPVCLPLSTRPDSAALSFSPPGASFFGISFPRDSLSARSRIICCCGLRFPAGATHRVLAASGADWAHHRSGSGCFDSAAACDLFFPFHQLASLRRWILFWSNFCLCAVWVTCREKAVLFLSYQIKSSSFLSLNRSNVVIPQICP
jgi:hypothetical protein